MDLNTGRRAVRVLACASSLVLALTSAACGGDDDDDSEGTAGGDVTEVTGAATVSTEVTTDGPTQGTKGTIEATTAGTPVGSETTTPSDGDEAQPGGEITWLVYIAQSSWDPKLNLGGGATSQGQIYAVYDSLIRIAPDGTITPRLAESVTPDEDFSTWTIELRPDLMFTDDTPLDAAAVKANWDRHADPATASQCILQASTIASTTAQSATTLVVELNQPNSQFPFLLDGCLGFIASPTAIETHGDQYGTSAETTVGAGPFMVEAYNPGVDSTLVKNPDYWDAPRPYLDRVKIVGVPSDTQSAAQALITDQAQMISFGIATPAMTTVEDAGYEPYQVDIWGGQGWMFNTTKPPLDDVRVRKALVLALDRDVLADQAFAGLGKLGPTFFPEDSPYYDESLTNPEHDPEEAQRLIDEYLAEKGGSIDVEMIGLEGQMNAVGTSAQQQLSQLDGVNFEVRFLPPLGLRDAYFGGNFEIAAYILSGVNGYPELPQYLGTDQPRNLARFSDPAVDEAFARITSTDDQDVINEAYGEVAARVLDQVPYAILWATDVRTYAQDNVKGITLYRDHVVELEQIHLD